MKGLLTVLLPLLITIAKFLGPGGEKTVVADSLLMKQQRLVINGDTPSETTGEAPAAVPASINSSGDRFAPSPTS